MHRRRRDNGRRPDAAMDALMERTLAGDVRAFEKLVSQHYARVHAFTSRMVGADAADDVAQDVFLRVYRSLASYRGDASFTTWLHRIAHNTCLDYVRRQRRVAAIVGQVRFREARRLRYGGAPRLVAAAGKFAGGGRKRSRPAHVALERGRPLVLRLSVPLCSSHRGKPSNTASRGAAPPHPSPLEEWFKKDVSDPGGRAELSQRKNSRFSRGKSRRICQRDE